MPGASPGFFMQKIIMENKKEVLELPEREIQPESYGNRINEKIIGELEKKISVMLQGKPDAFFQLMYRLDVSEKKLMLAMKDKGNAVRKIAVLIFERQSGKLKTRRNTKKVFPAEKDLAW